MTAQNEPAESTVQDWPIDTVGMEVKRRNVRDFLVWVTEIKPRIDINYGMGEGCQPWLIYFLFLKE